MFLKESKPTTSIFFDISKFHMENVEENPAEPVPDIATVAEPGQPSEPEDTISMEVTNEAPLTSENIADSRNDAAEISEIVMLAQGQPSVELEVADIGKFDENIVVDEMKVPEVPAIKELVDNFAQTFFKFMKNLPDKRCVEIVNMNVDHEDRSLVFFCSSQDLLESFDER